MELEMSSETAGTATATEMTAEVRRAGRSEALEDTVLWARQCADAKRQELAGKLAEGYLLDHYEVERLVVAVALAGIWGEVRLHVERNPECRDYVDAARIVAAEKRDALIRAAHASRSTSVFANAWEDAERDATAKFLDDVDVRWAVRNG